MNIMDWISINRPGKIIELRDRYEISHDSGEWSTLFKNISKRPPECLLSLGDIYTVYDGIDLFSSTFKIAAIETSKNVEDVELVGSLNDLKSYLSILKSNFPEEAIPFMYQAGIGVYAIGITTGRIYEWDTEESKVSGKYTEIEQIFYEWLRAIV